MSWPCQSRNQENAFLGWQHKKRGLLSELRGRNSNNPLAAEFQKLQQEVEILQKINDPQESTPACLST
ncbi:MAG: hypothetical protein V7K71_31465 [Nostoc sp.]